MDRHQLGQRLRALRAASGRTVAAVATDAGLSVPYVANLENGRGNPTVDALSRIARALGTQATIEFAAKNKAAENKAAENKAAENKATENKATENNNALPAALVRLGRGARFRRDVALIGEALGEDPTAMAARILDVLARLAEVTGRDLGESDWLRLLDALLLVTLHPQPGK